MNVVAISAEMADGTTYTATVPDKSYMGLGDRVAFERRFGTSTSAVMMQLGGAFTVDDDGEQVVADDADLSELREEHHAFFAWRGLRRECDGVPDFDEFIDNAVDLEIDREPDPTEPVEDN